ncbi:hypothetical protein Microterr_19850 [Microbacterium terricola]|uniref:Uncharacterized protein n=1 Tax=Microbacterium terricola TaxID=344163 RepID=A0ABM8E0H8_9MICO|nr:hypothetical protein Microterr_19850 [Microbacterium terricola]
MVVACVDMKLQPVVPARTAALRASDAMKREFTDPPRTDDGTQSFYDHAVPGIDVPRLPAAEL